MLIITAASQSQEAANQKYAESSKYILCGRHTPSHDPGYFHQAATHGDHSIAAHPNEAYTDGAQSESAGSTPKALTEPCRRPRAAILDMDELLEHFASVASRLVGKTSGQSAPQPSAPSADKSLHQRKRSASESWVPNTSTERRRRRGRSHTPMLLIIS